MDHLWHSKIRDLVNTQMKRSYIGKTSMVLLLTISLAFPSCISQKKREQTITISGAFALYPLVVQWSEEYCKTHPDIRFNISGGGAGKGMADALAGAVDLGMFSREIEKEEIEKGVWWVGLTIDAVVPTISSNNPFLAELKEQGISRDEFRGIFIDGNISSWDQLLGFDKDHKFVVYTRSDACGAAGTWAKYLEGKQEDLRGIGIYGDPGLAEAVAKDMFGIAFNNTIFVYDINTGRKRPGIEVIPLDINSNDRIDSNEDFYDTFDEVLRAISDGVYPSPPARELYFVAHGKPEKKAVLDFIEWTLSEGQKYVREAGYVPVELSKIEEYKAKLR